MTRRSKTGSDLAHVRQAIAKASAKPATRSQMEVGAWLAKYMLRPAGAVLLALARALFGTPLDGADLAALALVTRFKGRPRTQGYREAIWLAGRRSGKSSGAAAVAVYEAVERGAEHMRYLSAGQRGHVKIISKTQAQAKETFKYASAISTRHFADVLDGEPLESQSGGEVRFANGIVISVGTASSSSLRGYTVVMAIVDEASFMGGADEEADGALDEILSALRFAMLAPVGAPMRRLLVISSPGVRSGYLWESGKKYATDAEAPVLVAHGASYVWNPTLDRKQLEAEKARDPRRYAREVEAEFVDSINPLLDADSVQRAAAGRDEDPLPLDEYHYYVAALDLGLRRDSTALTICYRDDSDDLPRVVVAGVWRWSPKPGAPLDVSDVIKQAVKVLNRYGVGKLVADQWAFDSVRALFRLEGIELIEHTWNVENKTKRFNVVRDLLIDSRLSLPANERLLGELRGLDETILPSGNIRIAARGRGHDDCAFSCVLAVSQALLTERPFLDALMNVDLDT